MANFFRTLRLSLKYRWTIAAATFCALMVAILWGGNIGALYPVVEVVFKGQSLDQWIADEIVTAQKNVADFDAKLAAEQVKQPADADEAKQLARSVGYLESRARAEGEYLDKLLRAQPWVDQYLAIGPFQTLMLVIAALFIGTLIKSAFVIGGQLLVERLAQLTTFELRKSFYRRTLRMDLASFGEKSTSDLIARFTNDMACISLGIQLFFGRAVREPLKTAACLIGAAVICWPLLLLSLLVVPIAALLIHALAKSMKRASRRAMEDMTVLFKVLSETLGGIKIVKAFTMERFERRRFHRVSKQYYHRAMRMALYDSFVRPTTEVMGILMIAMAILAGAHLVLNQETHLFGVIWMSDRPLTLGQLLLFYGLLAGVSDPSRKIGDVFGHLQRAYVSADRVYEVLDREPKILDPQRPAPLARHNRELSFEGVNFAYSPSHPILHDINLTIEFGETIAIVGPNGCGKSTLANLIPRFFDPLTGSVKIDGLDLRAVRRRELRRQVGLVTQETSLFDDTVLANIRYGTPWATREEAIAAAMKAHAHRFITDQLPNGYETVVGPTGNRLSGGQRQRIALARAILRDPSILILDEATSQVDLESEQLIQKILADFVRDRTTIIITHRMSILTLADRIVVMEGGRILDAGTHEQLLGRCDLYARLCQIDFREAA